MLYLKTLIIAFVIPALAMLFYLHKNRILHDKLKAILITTLIFAILVIPLDIYITDNGVWTFSKENTVGIFIFGMPIEEYLWIIPLIIAPFLGIIQIDNSEIEVIQLSELSIFYFTVVPSIIIFYITIGNLLNKKRERK